jgi:hemerythrin
MKRGVWMDPDMRVKWTSDFETGIEIIDNQHKELFKNINELLDSCERGEAKEGVIKIFDFLEQYVIFHFGTEEDLMIKYRYPNYYQHRMLHDRFIIDMNGLKREFLKNGISEGFLMLIKHFVIDWLKYHIGGEDKRLGVFLMRFPEILLS